MTTKDTADYWDSFCYWMMWGDEDDRMMHLNRLKGLLEKENILPASPQDSNELTLQDRKHHGK